MTDPRRQPLCWATDAKTANSERPDTNLASNRPELDLDIVFHDVEST